MKDESNQLLDDLLAEWFLWSKPYRPVAGYGSNPVFENCKPNRQWDTENEILDEAGHKSKMRAIAFHIGEMEYIHRVALGINARNICTGRSVWLSAALPKDAKERAIVLMEARLSLLLRLRSAGII